MIDMSQILPAGLIPTSTSILGAGESIDADFVSEVRRGKFEIFIYLDSNPVGDSNHTLKVRDNGSNGDDALVPQRFLHGVSGRSDIRRSGNHCVRIGNQLSTIRNAGSVFARPFCDGPEIQIAFLTALTEQVRMCSRSVKALIDGGYAGGHQFNLSSVQAVRVADLP